MSKRIVGFYFASSIAKNATAECDFSEIAFEKMTHINWAFWTPTTDGSLVQKAFEWNANAFPTFIRKAHEAGTKVIISIGGWTNSSSFPALCANPLARSCFVENCCQAAVQYGFDGIDIDWEFPGYASHNGTVADKDNFTLLIQELGPALQKLQIELSINLPGHMKSESEFDIAALIPFVDYFSLMTYDQYVFEDQQGAKVWHNSALYSDPDAHFPSVHSVVECYLGHGLPKEKIQIGLAFYGRGFRGCEGVMSPCKAVGGAKGSAFWMYHEIEQLKESGLLCHEDWCDIGQVPVCFQKGYEDQIPINKRGDKEWISYENERSLALKCDYTIEQEFAGVLIWHLGADGKEQPLLRTVFEKLK